MTRTTPTRLVVVVGLALLGLLVAPAVGADGAPTDKGFVYLTTETDPAQPTTESAFNFTTVLTNSPESTERFTVREIELTDGPDDGADTYDRLTYSFGDYPSLRPGGTFRGELTVDIDTPGTHPIYVTAELRSQDGVRFIITNRVNVTVYHPHPGLQARASATKAGQRTSLSLKVANGFDRPIRDLKLDLESPTVAFKEPSRIGSSIAGGASETFQFNATPESLGTQPIEATLAYTDANGTRRQVSRTLDVVFEGPPLNGRVNFAADVAMAIPGSQTSLNLTVSNGLDQDIREFEVAIEAEGVTVQQPRRIGTTLESGATRQFSFTVSRPTEGDQVVDVALSYTTVNGIERRVNRTLSVTFTGPENPGSVSITGLNFDRTGDRLRVSGSASNVGETAVRGVVITIGSNEAVRPGATEAEFFVGTVEASDFVSFDVNADLLTNRTPVSVPLQVSYTVDGVRRERTLELTYEGSNSIEPANQPAPSSPPLGLIGGAVVALLIVVLGVWGWRRGRS